MGFRLPIAALLVCLSGLAQSLSVTQVQDFVRSSVKQKLPDAQVAAYLQKVKLSQNLDAQTVEDLQSSGAGPKTVAVLKTLMAHTAALPPPPPPPAPKVYVEPAPPPYEEQQKLINEIREYALNYTKSLPDFVCLQLTRRYVNPRGGDAWGSPVDTIAAKLSYAEQKEHYEVLTRNGQMLPKGTDIHSKSLGGTTSSGEFGSMLRYIFEPSSDAEFHWEKWGNLRGNLTYVFNYKVEQARSNWGISDGETGREVTPGYQGLIYVDVKTHQILRTTYKSVDIPADFPIQLAEEELNYNYADIGGHQFLLPMIAEVRLNRGGMKTKNENDFKSYHKYSASSDIIFDSADTGAEDTKSKGQPPK